MSICKIILFIRDAFADDSNVEIVFYNKRKKRAVGLITVSIPESFTQKYFSNKSKLLS